MDAPKTVSSDRAPRVPRPLELNTSIDVVMKGGGAKGAAHIGAIEVLGNVFDIRTYAGTSAGALAAVFFAVGHSPAEVLELVSEPYRSIRGGDRATPVRGSDVARMIDHGALFDCGRLEAWIDRSLRAKLDRSESIVGPVTFFELANRAKDRRKNCLVFATDARQGLVPYGFVRVGQQTRYIGSCSKVSVASAVVASLAIPFVFDPPEGLGTFFLDGGLCSNFPIEPTRSILEKNGVVANLVGVSIAENDDVGSLSGLARTSALMLNAITSARDQQHAVELDREARLLALDAGPVTTLDFHIDARVQKALVERARARAVNFCLRHLVDAYGGVEQIPLKGDRRLYEGDVASGWSTVADGADAKERTSFEVLESVDVTTGRPQWLRIVAVPLLRLLLRRYWVYVAVVVAAVAAVVVLGIRQFLLRVSPDELAERYVERSVVDERYVLRQSLVGDPGVAPGAASGDSQVSPDALLYALLADLSGVSASVLRSLPTNSCRPELRNIVSPASRAKLLTHLRGPHERSRGVVALAFAACSNQLVDAYHLAEAVRRDEPDADWEDIVSALSRIVVSSEEAGLPPAADWVRTELGLLADYLAKREGDPRVIRSLREVGVEELLRSLGSPPYEVGGG